MAGIRYEAKRFSSLPLGGLRSSSTSRYRAKGRRKTSKTVLTAYAATVGDASVLSGGPSRPALELVWRKAMLQSSLTTHSGNLKKSKSYTRLDGSEKTAISYFLGMIQAAFMADDLLGIPVVVHVDRMLNLLTGKVPKKSRPDLVGYTRKYFAHGTGRVLIEAKGRTHGYSQKPVNDALAQVKHPIPAVTSLLGPHAIGIASLAYFAPVVRGGTPVWTSYLEDPPPRKVAESQIGDEQFCGTVIASQLLPIALAIKDLRRLDFSYQDQNGWTGARLPLDDSTISLPTAMYNALIEIDAPLRDKESREQVTRNIWEIAGADEYPNDQSEGSDDERNVYVLGSGLAISEPQQSPTDVE